MSGCGKADVKYAFLRPAPSATLAGGIMTVHVGSDIYNSACWTRLRVKIAGQTVYISGRRVLREQNREVAIKLPPSMDASRVALVWVDPDGRIIPVAVTRS